MSKYFFTFGSNHETKGGFSLGRSFVVIEADNLWEARDIMHKARGEVWAFSYTEKEFAGQQEAYGLTCLTLEQVALY